MTRFDQLSSWIILAVLSATFLGGLGLYVVHAALIAPQCGPVAESQLRAASDDVARRIPGLRFEWDEAETSCDSFDAISVFWTHDDYNRLLTEATQAGCQVQAGAVTTDDELLPLFTCRTMGRAVDLYLDEVKVHSTTGSMALH